MLQLSPRSTIALVGSSDGCPGTVIRFRVFVLFWNHWDCTP